MDGGDWRDVQEQKAWLLKNNIVDPVEKLAKKDGLSRPDVRQLVRS